MQIDELLLSVVDLAAARAFYTTVLQFAEEPMEDGVALRAGRTRLVFRAATKGERPVYHIAFGIPLARFDAARRHIATYTPLITANGDEIIVHTNWNAVAFYFSDPAGNILECIARRGEPTDSEESLEAGISSVCEVGLVVELVPALVATLRSALGVEPFRGSEDETFTAIGTEDGLLIVVQRGRVWYPDTGVAATPAPLQVTLSATDGTQHRISGPPYHVEA